MKIRYVRIIRSFPTSLRSLWYDEESGQSYVCSISRPSVDDPTEIGLYKAENDGRVSDWTNPIASERIDFLMDFQTQLDWLKSQKDVIALGPGD